MKKFFCIAVAFCTLFLCGCWDAKEPSQLAMITCVVMDVDDENTYTVYTELLDTMLVESSEPPEGNKSFHKHEGKTFSDAIYAGANNYGREIFGGVNKIRIFTQRFAERGFVDEIDFFLRSPYTDETPHLIIYKSDNGISEFFETKPSMDTLYGTYFENLANTEIKETSEGGNVQILDFVKAYMSEGIQPVAGVLEARDKEPDSEEKEFVYEGLAVFKEEKLVGYLDKTETRAYNIIMGKAKGLTQTIQTENGETITASAGKCKNSVKVKFENGKPLAEINVKMKMNLIQQPSLLNTDKFEIQHAIEKEFSEKFAKEFADTIARVQQDYKSDIFGFGNSLMGHDYKQWLSVKDEWDDNYFPETEVTVNVECKIEHSGQINRSLREKE